MEPLAADAFEMAQEVDDADEAALFLAFGDLLAALEGKGTRFCPSSVICLQR